MNPSDHPATPGSEATRLRKVALAGNPNVGKSTVFNALTGMRQKVGNYPGVTVERRSGRMPGDSGVEIVDLPGAYSLSPKSLDERVVYDVLAGKLEGEAAPDLVVCIVDASNLERNLYLVSQIADLGIPAVLALNMMDAAERAGIEIDVSVLGDRLGMPVYPLVASRGTGLETLAAALRGPLPAPAERRWRLLPALEQPVAQLTRALSPDGADDGRTFSDVVRALSSDTLLDEWKDPRPDFFEAVTRVRADLAARRVPYQQAEVMSRYAWLSPLVAQVVRRKRINGEGSLSDRIDGVLTHRVFGLVLFFAILALVFQAVFSWATPAMDGIEAAFNGLGTLLRRTLPDGLLASLVVDGVVAGVGNVVVFLPQILLLFFFLGLMEDTGYMARTAFIMDRVMRRVGLTGGSVVPLLSSFACAVPGIMAARTLPNEKDRLITIMVAPLMSCSARLPVYTLFIAAFIPARPILGILGMQGLAMFSLYLLGTVMAFVAAWILKKRVFKGGSGYFAMELPPYRMPQLKMVLWRMVERARIFVSRAGRVIFLMSVVLWFLATFPRSEPGPDIQALERSARSAYQTAVDSLAEVGGVDPAALSPDGPDPATLVASAVGPIPPDVITAVAAARDERDRRLGEAEDLAARDQVRNSAIGRIGRFIEPLMQPLGFDWKLSTGILAAFAAREVIVGVLGTLYSVGDADETSLALRDHLRADRYPDTGEPVFTPLVAVSFMIFFVFALQCMSTLAIARRETNSWLWPTVMWLYMTALAYGASLLVYQGGLALGLG